ncbi:MAG: leucyl aminopeptidase [Polyangiaceae bacterium]|nr:leucyl aminopeptidase [Polyangiaceae bacterium]
MPLNVQATSGEFSAAAVDVLAVFATEGDLAKQKPLSELNKALGGGLLEHAGHVDFTGKSEQTLDVVTLGKIKPKHVIVIGLGKKDAITAAALRSYAAVAARFANSVMAKSLALALPDPSADLRPVAEGAKLGAYRFSKYFTGDRVPKSELREVLVYVGRATPAHRKQLALGAAVADAVIIARDAVNEPPNELYPLAMAEIARKIAKKGKLKIQVFDKKAIQQKGMKLLYAVGQGSVHEPCFIHMSYVPKKAKKKIVFVGKGLTFDSGGLCIKPAPGMGDMKSDMGGAAAVLGLMAAVSAIAPSVEVHGVIASAENMPDAGAYRPGDVFGSLSGKTVEIVNTDAEGRLVLADALTYASRLKPDVIIDAATLTGACMVALGKTCSAFYTADDDLAGKFAGSARAVGEQFWRMPLLDDLREQLKSDVADLKHTGERWGGSISAALFLREFVEGAAWIHCDIAGPVLGDRAKGVYPKGGTGHPVLTFLDVVESMG